VGKHKRGGHHGVSLLFLRMVMRSYLSQYREELHAGQTLQMLFELNRSEESGSAARSAEVIQFVADKFRAVLAGSPIAESSPPALDLICSHSAEVFHFFKPIGTDVLTELF
jgi:hypothetical protein